MEGMVRAFLVCFTHQELYSLYMLVFPAIILLVPVGHCCFRCIFQLFRTDVVKVDRDVVYVAMMFQLYVLNFSSVLDVCCKVLSRYCKSRSGCCTTWLVVVAAARVQPWVNPRTWVFRCQARGGHGSLWRTRTRVLGWDVDSGRGARCGALQLSEPRPDVRWNLAHTVSIMLSCIYIIDGYHVSDQRDLTTHLGGRKTIEAAYGYVRKYYSRAVRLHWPDTW
jgi:hypothetical protein